MVFFSLLSALMITSNASASERVIHCVREGSAFNQIAELTLRLNDTSGIATVARMNSHVPEAEGRVEETNVQSAYLENANTWQEVFHWGEFTSMAAELGIGVTEEVVLVRSAHHTGTVWSLRKIRTERAPLALCAPYAESGCTETSAILQEQKLYCTDGKI